MTMDGMMKGMIQMRAKNNSNSMIQKKIEHIPNQCKSPHFPMPPNGKLIVVCQLLVGDGGCFCG